MMSRFAVLAVACTLGFTSFAHCSTEGQLRGSVLQNSSAMLQHSATSEHNSMSNFGNSRVLLRDAPFLYTHDAATGYIGIKDYRDVAFETQFVNPISQLDCGARALDIRLVIDGDSIHFHHGSDRFKRWTSEETMDRELPNFIQWCHEHPDELVLLVISHCYSKSDWKSVNCNHDKIKHVLEKHSVPKLIDSCNVADMTLGEVNKKASLPSGGKLMAILGEAGPTQADQNCFSQTWWSSVTNRGLVLPYVKAIMKQEKGKKKMFAVQAFIQQDSIKVPMSSALNLDLFGWVTDGLLNGVNLLEVNGVCSYGADVSQLLGATVSKSDRNKCKQACGVHWATLKEPAPSPGKCSFKRGWTGNCELNWNKCGSPYTAKNYQGRGVTSCDCECAGPGTCAGDRINKHLPSGCTTLWNKCPDGWRPHHLDGVGIGSCSKCECVPAKDPA